MLRVLFGTSILILLLAVGAALEAAAKTDAAFNALSATRAIQDKERGDGVLERAANGLEHSWVKPLAWSAYANEAHSALAALRYEATGNRIFLTQSARSARRALSISPLLTQTWIRSAQLSLLGAPGVPCQAIECLEVSWRIAPISDPQTDCLRLRLAHRANMRQDEMEAHIMTFARTDVPIRTLARCLDFMPAEQKLAIILRARAYSR